MSGYAKGDRVSYTVMYGSGLAGIQRRTAYGRITRVQPDGLRQPRATIAVENPEPGATRYVTRSVADIAPA